MSKYKETVRNTVDGNSGLVRLPQVGTDILVTLNNPIQIHPDSSTSSAAGAQPSADETMRVFRQILGTFAILDWNLFAA